MKLSNFYQALIHGAYKNHSPRPLASPKQDSASYLGNLKITKNKNKKLRLK